MSSILSSQKYYINSADRIKGTNQAFEIGINIPIDSGFDSVAVIDASIPLSYYVIRQPYNVFTLNEGSSSVNITIVPGNYNVNNFLTAMTALLNTNSPTGYTYSMTFSIVTAKYTYSVTGNGSVQPTFIFSDFLVSQMGFSNHSTNTFIGNKLTSSDVISFVATQALYITCDLVTDESNILQSIFTNNSVPYSYIAYSCQNVEHYMKKLSTTKHSSMVIRLIDAQGQEIDLNGIDWQLTILLFKKNNITHMFKSLLDFISVKEKLSNPIDSNASKDSGVSN
jgi:hypothetical protein